MDNLHPKSILIGEIVPGISIKFGESKSKLGSKQYKLGEISFLKSMYTEDDVITFWSTYRVYFITDKNKNKKIPPIINMAKNLIHDVQIVVCDLRSADRLTFLTQIKDIK
jgi:hypothetical protein